MPDRGQLVEDLLRGVAGTGDRVAVDDAVVGDRVNGLLRHGVHGVGGDQLGDIQGVGVVRVLHAGGRPQRPLHSRAVSLERLVAVAADEHLLVCRVCQPGVGHARLSTQRQCLVAADLLQSLVDLGVHPGDEERCDGMDLGHVVAGLLRSLQAGQIGIHHQAVPFDGEDQCHVDRNSFGDNRSDRRQAGHRRGDLDQEVGPVDDLPQLDRLQDRLVGVMGEARIDLDRYPAVDAVGLLVLLGQHVAGVADVVGGHGADRGVHVGAAFGEFFHLPVVGGALRQCRLKNAGVGGDAHDALGVDQLLQIAGLQSVAGQVVKPYGHARGGQRGEVGILSHAWSFSLISCPVIVPRRPRRLRG